MIELPDLPAGVYEHWLRKVEEFFSDVQVVDDWVPRFRYLGPKAW